jgi:hypothetical protein
MSPLASMPIVVGRLGTTHCDRTPKVAKDVIVRPEVSDVVPGQELDPVIVTRSLELREGGNKTRRS